MRITSIHICYRLQTNLSIVDFALHGIVRDETINVTWLHLPVPVNSTDGLTIMAGVPRGIENDHSIRTHQIHTQ